MAADPGGATTLDLGASAAAKRAEAATMLAAEFAADTYRAARPDEAAAVAPDHALPVRAGVPDEPLLRALADLGAAAYAMSRATHLATAASGPAVLIAATRAADATAAAVSEAVAAVLAEPTPEGPAASERLAHAAARACHLAGDALEAQPRRARDGGLIVHHPTVPFPPSWRALLDDLHHHLVDTPHPGDAEPHAHGSRAALLAAARAARDAAEHTRRAYEDCSFDTPAARGSCRAARLSVLATTYCGWEALRRATHARPPS
jgi:hypothetical protein